MNKNKKLRRQLFPIMAADLESHRPNFIGKILCPLCLKPFDAEANEAGLVTAEHIIPAKLGGDSFTLTCKDSNSLTGAKLGE
jgi:hypothetical protein